jgi:hypothetical protein
VVAGDAMFQVFQVFSDVCFKCRIWMLHKLALPACFKRVFQVFYMFHTYVAVFNLDVTKVDLDMLHMLLCLYMCGLFHLFQTYVANVSF